MSSIWGGGGGGGKGEKEEILEDGAETRLSVGGGQRRQRDGGNTQRMTATKYQKSTAVAKDGLSSKPLLHTDLDLVQDLNSFGQIGFASLDSSPEVSQEPIRSLQGRLTGDRKRFVIGGSQNGCARKQGEGGGRGGEGARWLGEQLLLQKGGNVTKTRKGAESKAK